MADLASLRAFVAVARLGHVGRAAERLHRTQPSVSARLAGLEEAWGTRLFRRHPRGMSLTPEGARLLPLAEAALRSAEALEEAAGSPLRGARELRVGAGDALGRELLPRTIARLLEADPGLEVRLVEGPGPRLAQGLAAGEIDVALTLSGEAAPPAGLEVAPLLESRVDLLLPPGTAPARSSRPLGPGFLEGRRLVLLQTGSAFRRHVEVALARAGVVPLAAVEVGNLSLVRRFVAAGLGIAPVPAVAFGASRGAGVERRPASGIPPVRYARLVRSGAPLPAPVDRFLSVLAKEAARPR
jgi:LysR family hydrogen peroxide-inducible transcriptional activator